MLEHILMEHIMINNFDGLFTMGLPENGFDTSIYFNSNSEPGVLTHQIWWGEDTPIK